MVSAAAHGAPPGESAPRRREHPATRRPALRDAGHDVHAILEDARGASDEDVLAAARTQSRILLTFDLDMGQLVFERRLGVPPGIIVFRDVPPTLADTVQLVVTLLDRQDLMFEGQFTVVTGDRIRQRPLPAV